MAQSNSAEATTVDTDEDLVVLDQSDEYIDKPLIKLFKRLIGNDSKQNTVLTNAQIVEILKKEFLMDISYVHELEIEIYLNLMKKFLKDWPQWDDFDHKIQSLKTQGDDNRIDKVELESNYINLKEYLSKMLDTAKPLIESAVNEVKETVGKDNPKGEGNVVLEVNCTREQLNKLFFRRPHPDRDNTIFNIEPNPPKIKLHSHSMKSIFNWPNTYLIVNLGGVLFKRETSNITKRRLVNKKLNHWKEAPKELKVGIERKNPYQTTHGELYTLHHLFNVLSKSYRIFPKDICPLAVAITELLTSDLTCSWDMGIPCQFRKTLNKYPYSRYLYSEVNTAADEQIKLDSFGYDLQLEETIVPTINLNILKFDKARIKYNEGWLIVKCMECNLEFADWSFKTHFEEYHQSEPNWKCTNCGKEFEMVQLSENSWSHNCQEQT